MGFDSKSSFVMAERLKRLRKERSLSHEKLSSVLYEQYGVRISSDSLINYEVAEVNHCKAYKNQGMRVEYLYCLADFYGVSADYLLGRTDIRSPDEDIKATCKFTGLSEQAVKNLKAYSNQSISFINELIEQAGITHIALLYENLNRARKEFDAAQRICSGIDKRSTAQADLRAMRTYHDAKEKVEFERWKLERSVMTILGEMMGGKKDNGNG